MRYLNRNIIVCEVKGVSHTRNSQTIYYIPELTCIQSIIPSILHDPIGLSLRKKILQLVEYQKRHGTGALPLPLSATKQFIEQLYNELLQNKITLPPNISELDLNYAIKNYDKIKCSFFTYDLKIKIERNHLSFFARNLPWIGTIVTFTLTVGLTVSTLVTIIGWGWSLVLFSVFGLSKLLTSYADIAGGPERRLLLLGLWLDRLTSRHYPEQGKFSLPKFSLNFLVVAILACSSLLTWYGAWQLIRCMNGISYIPNGAATLLAGLFAWSSAGASFGRIYQDLYQLLHQQFSSYFSFDSFKEEEKISFKNIKTNLSRKSSKNEFLKEDCPIPSKALTMYYKSRTPKSIQPQTEKLPKPKSRLG